MAEYIEREALLEDIRKIGNHPWSDWETAGVLSVVLKQPAADVAPVVHGAVTDMTSNELHKEKIVPLRFELQRLEKEYEKLYRQECGEKIGERASCDNCAFSCVLSISDHNGCMGGKCTCCNSWCYWWTPENDVSRFLRENYHYDDSMFYRLENVFGDGFLKSCDTPQQKDIVMEMVQLIARFDGKVDGE